MRELETNGVGAETNRSAAGDAALTAEEAAVKTGEAAAETGDAAPSPADAHETVEAAVRAQLSKALGGVRGVIEAAVPTAGFTLSYVISDQLRLSLIIAVAAAVVLLAVRVAQKSNPQFVINSLFGIAIAAFFAMRSGKAEDAFLPGILYNSGYAVAMIFSIVVRWPVVGFIIGSVTGDPTAWRNDPGIVKLCSRLTWLLVLPCVVRVVVQYPLYLAGQVGWLGASKIFMGWPLQVAAFAGMAWLLARGRTPITAARTSAPAS
ncbi:DUF3159 domain-containing protein [Actinomadura rudentiformis]|uniref:DUF3159 domain-containing protein n=1 Tax=Actinomadura rudentiformis TaxID=359158 RepID=UPI00384C59F4